MILNAYAIFDTASKLFAQPLFLVSDGVAQRVFSDEVNRSESNNQLYKHPDDFLLYRIGTYDDSTGKLSPLEDLELLTSGKQVKVRE